MQPSRPPRPWIAALIGLPCPGLGLFYARAPWLGALLALAMAAALAGVAAVQQRPPAPWSVGLLLTCAGLILLLPVVSAVAGYVQARWTRWRGQAQAPGDTVLMLGAAGIVGFLGLVTAPLWLGGHWLHFYLPSDSMLPTLAVGTRLYSAAGPAPDRGMIVVFRPRAKDDTQYIKRIVGVAGDSVRLQGGRLFVNGTPAAAAGPAQESLDGHAYAVVPMPSRMSGASSEMPQQTVPPGHLFVLGDNRPNSLDSRFPQFGFIPLDRVDAVGGVTYWAPGEGLHLRPLQ